MNIQSINLVGVMSCDSINNTCQCGIPIMTKFKHSTTFNKINILENNIGIHSSCYDAFSEDDKKINPIITSHNDAEPQTLIYSTNS